MSKSLLHPDSHRMSIPASLFTPLWPAPSHIHTHVSIHTQTPSSFYQPRRTSRQYKHPVDSRALQARIQQIHHPVCVQYLRQNHSNRCVHITHSMPPPLADACITTQDHLAASVYTADCLPILITNHTGSLVASIHAGWKGLYHDILSATIKSISGETSELIAWVGPSICPQCYRISAHFQADFTQKHPDSSAFFYTHSNELCFDLRGFACQQLRCLGLTSIYHNNLCTYHHPTLPSYRQHGALASRLFFLIWKTPF